MAAEWAAMAEAAAGGGRRRRGRRGAVLEGEPAPRARKARSAPPASSIRTRSTACWASAIDAGGGKDNSGIRAIINSALVSYERLPMLEVVFDRLVRMMSTSLRNFTSDNVEVVDRQHHLDPLRRLSELDPAAGDADASSRPRNGTITACSPSTAR